MSRTRKLAAMTYEEAQSVLAICTQFDLSFVPLVAPTCPDARMAEALPRWFEKLRRGASVTRRSPLPCTSAFGSTAIAAGRTPGSGAAPDGNP